MLEVVNDGVATAATTEAAGVGLRLAAFEALESGGIVDFGPVAADPLARPAHGRPMTTDDRRLRILVVDDHDVVH